MNRTTRVLGAVASAAAIGLAGGASAATWIVDADSQTFHAAPPSEATIVVRSPRDVYFDETGQPALVEPAVVVIQRDELGMSPAEVSRITGKVDSSTAGVPRSGSGAQPGNMGPANSKGQ